MQKIGNKIARIVYKGNNFTYIIGDVSFPCDYIKSNNSVYFLPGKYYKYDIL